MVYAPEHARNLDGQPRPPAARRMALRVQFVGDCFESFVNSPECIVGNRAFD
jgi:hypothetical protein